MQRRLLSVTALLALAVAAIVISGTASAARPPSGSSTGSGQVFFPNPVAQLQDQSLTDQKDADYPALQPAYRVVTLTNLDGSGYLVGDWANVVSETGDRAHSTTKQFIYTRNDDRFE
jgi:zinc metalloprotease ZmpB